MTKKEDSKLVHVDDLEEYNQNLAKKQVDRIPESLFDDIGPLVILERNYHLGVDSFGNRLTPEEWRVVKETKEALRNQLSIKYSEGDVVKFYNYLRYYNVGNKWVDNEIIRRVDV